MYQAYKPDLASATGWSGYRCLFDLKREQYSWVIASPTSPFANYRGTNGGTSADAAGWPLTPGTVTLDELADGEINHGLRFSTLNIKSGSPLYPASHNAGATSNANAMPEGTRLRLKPAINIEQRFPIQGTPGTNQYKASQLGRLILKASQKYGLFCADGQSGANFSISGESDIHTERKWTEWGGRSVIGNCVAGFEYQASNPLTLDDFEVVSNTWQFQQYQNYESKK
jgi:hypothetical protein